MQTAYYPFFMNTFANEGNEALFELTKSLCRLFNLAFKTNLCFLDSPFPPSFFKDISHMVVMKSSIFLPL